MDTKPAIRVWKNACSESHSFLPRRFVRESGRYLRARFRPENTFVFDDAGVKGFICLVNNSVNALFVEPSFQRQGIGRKLLAHAKGLTEVLTLGVFTQNTHGILFYHREGFFVVKRWFYRAADNEMLVMKWTRDWENDRLHL